MKNPMPVPDSAAKQRFIWIFGSLMVLTAGTAFLFKLYEFFHVATTSGSQALGSFLIPVLTYLIVAAGFFSMFMWAYTSGQFRDLEAPKYRMLEQQDQIDQLDELARRAMKPSPADVS